VLPGNLDDSYSATKYNSARVIGPALGLRLV